MHRATVRVFRDYHIDEKNIEWTPEPDKHSPWDYEWIGFVRSIRKDLPHNEAIRAVDADFAALLGKAACHLSRIVTWDGVLNCNLQFSNYLDELDYDSPPPVQADENGYFRAPVAGGKSCSVLERPLKSIGSGQRLGPSPLYLSVDRPGRALWYQGAVKGYLHLARRFFLRLGQLRLCHRADTLSSSHAQLRPFGLSKP